MLDYSSADDRQRWQAGYDTFGSTSARRLLVHGELFKKTDSVRRRSV